MMRLAALVTLGSFLVAPAVLACNCVSPSDPRAAYERAEAVVRGKVVALKPVPSRRGAKVKLAVTAAWKRASPAQLAIETLDLCSYAFRKGEEYVVFLVRDRKDLLTTRCMGNHPVREAQETLRWLEENGQRR